MLHIIDTKFVLHIIEAVRQIAMIERRIEKGDCVLTVVCAFGVQKFASSPCVAIFNPLFTTGISFLFTYIVGAVTAILVVPLWTSRAGQMAGSW